RSHSPRVSEGETVTLHSPPCSSSRQTSRIRRLISCTTRASVTPSITTSRSMDVSLLITTRVDYAAFEPPRERRVSWLSLLSGEEVVDQPAHAARRRADTRTLLAARECTDRRSAAGA